MKQQLTLIAVAALLAASVNTSQALPYNVRGSFNSWGETAMTDNGDGTHFVTVTSLTPGTGYDFKIAENDWGSSWPGGNCRTAADASGNITFRFRPAVTFDGWNPQAARVGFDDPGFGWEIIGAINDIGGGWDEPSNAAARQMANQGNGLYTVNYTIAKPAGTYDFKFRKSGDWGYQYTSDQFNPSGGNLQVTTTNANQSVLFQLDLKNGRWLAGAPLAAATNYVTFTVDMGVPIKEYPASTGFDTNFDIVYVRGNFNSWATESKFAISNRIAGTTIYSNTVPIVAYAGTTIQYKFFGDAFPGEESTLLSCGGTRSLAINSTAVTAPLAKFGDRSVSDPTNLITFRLDMSLQQSLGNFSPPGDLLYLRGTFNNYSTALQLTNLAAPNTNIYIGVVNATNWPIGSCMKYKYFTTHAGAPNGGWESPISTGGQDRQLNIASSTQTLPSVFYNDLDICDVVEQTNYVTFTVSMTNAVGTYTDSTVYDGTQNVYINGDFAGWWGWGNTNGAATNYLMTQVPGTSNYTYTAAIPAGSTLRLQYKYSMNGADDEAGGGNDHVRYIRTLPGQTSFSQPLDKWTGTVPANIANLQEPKFGMLTTATGVPGQVSVQWLGLKCVGLQSSTTLTNWTAHPATDGRNSTNWPATGSKQFFRLSKPNTVP